MYSAAQINMSYINFFLFSLYIVFYDVILLYSICSIVLRVRNKGDDHDWFFLSFLVPQTSDNLVTSVNG